MRFRTFRALLWKEAVLHSSRTGLWMLQAAFLAYLAAVILTVMLPSGDGDDGSGVERGESMARTLGLFVYYGALFLGPLLGAGALQEERERGMLEVLSAAPVPLRTLFAAIVAARLCLVGQFFLAAVPLFALPVLLGAGLDLAVLARALAAAALGAAATTLFAMTHFARGHGAGAVYGKLVVLVFFTPFAFGLRIFLWLLGLLLTLLAVSWLVELSLPLGMPNPVEIAFVILASAAFPFDAIGVEVALGRGSALVSTTAWSALVGLATVYFGRALRELRGWMRRQPGGNRFDFRSRKGRDREHRQARLARLISPPAVDDPAPGVPDALARPLRATQQLARLSGVRRAVYRLTRANPIAAKSLLDRAPESILVWGVVTVLFGIFVSVGGAGSPALLGTWSGISSLALLVATALVGSRLLPTGRGKHLEMLLSTPIDGRTLVVGAVGAAFTRGWPILLALGIWHGTVGIWHGTVGTIEAAPRWAAGSYSMVLAAFLLAAAIAAWSALLWRRTGQRIGGALGISAVLLLPSFLLDDATWVVRLSPAHYWESNWGGGARALDPLSEGTAGVWTFAAILALVSVAVLFDRVTRRAR